MRCYEAWQTFTCLKSLDATAIKGDARYIAEMCCPGREGLLSMALSFQVAIVHGGNTSFAYGS